jgi:two-component system phosphate regulon sensor histidine kinase PhoR
MEPLLATVIDAIPEPALALAPSGQIVAANRRATALFGGDLVTLDITQVSREPDLLAAIDAVSAGAPGRTVDVKARVPLARRLAIHVAPVVDPSAAAPLILISIRDLTEADRASRMRADFVANASHELRTPLSALRGFVETLQGAARDDPEGRDRFLRIMKDQAERMTRLIDDLLSLSRVEMREHVPPTTEVELGTLIDDVVESFEALSGRDQIRIDVEKPGKPLIVRGDRDELIQVFQNLIQNAIKYGRAGGTVSISLGRDGPRAGQAARARLSITDEGPGIAPEHLPRLTERFYRVNVASSREKGGTGLGLAIVKHILNRHSGELRVASQLGVGSTFTVLLPLAEQQKS